MLYSRHCEHITLNKKEGVRNSMKIKTTDLLDHFFDLLEMVLT